MKQSFNGIVYDTDSAVLLARNEHPYCVESIAKGRTDIDLFRTPEGLYFTYEVTVSFFGGQVSDPEVHPVSEEEAAALYHRLTDRWLDFEDAFPDYHRSTDEKQMVP